ncbi:MAG: GNAT family N-acetyltransferase [Candidatus Promineifilaceae bacterium]|nr:GNAT family N-acetyltransferase [Candidatus Promineifilaceae bacterium]
MPAHELVALFPRLRAIYQSAFAGPPYYKTRRHGANFINSLAKHRRQPAFRFLLATTTGPAGQTQSVGFSYGYLSRPGQWWHNSVLPRLADDQAALWLTDSFKLAELAVMPRYQGYGYGSALHDQLLQDLPSTRAVLSTIAADTVARRLYRKRGWVTLLPRFFFPGVNLPYEIMGLELPVSAAQSP